VLLVSFVVCYTAWKINLVGNSTVNQTFWVAMIFLFALLCGNLKESLFTAIYYIGVEACMDTTRTFIVRSIFGRAVSLYSPAYYVQMNVLYLLILGWTLFYYFVLKKRRGNLPLHFWIMMVAPPLVSMMLLTYFADLARPLQNDLGINIYHAGILIGLFLLALNFLTFFIYIKLLAFFESQLQTQVLQGQLDVYARQIKSIETAHERTEVARHEMKNLLLVLQSAIAEQNYDEAGKRLRAVLGDMDSGTLKPYTGLTVIDAMLSYKAERLAASGADIAVHTAALEIPDETAYDIAAMLAIMLDNAADAAATAASGTSPFTIHCDIKQKDHIIIITFTNPLSAPLRYHNGEIASAKPESGHGLGLPSLRRLAQKYGGDIKITDDDGLFTITVLLFVSVGAP
jgi:hypothetical protein